MEEAAAEGVGEAMAVASGVSVGLVGVDAGADLHPAIPADKNKIMTTLDPRNVECQPA